VWGDVRSEGAGRPRRYTEVPQRLLRPWVLADFFLRSHEILLSGVALGSAKFVEEVFRSNRGAFGADGTWRGDRLILRAGVTQRWVVAGLCVLRNRRFELGAGTVRRMQTGGAFAN
jgi:hypothetical protein